MMIFEIPKNLPLLPSSYFQTGIKLVTQQQAEEGMTLRDGSRKPFEVLARCADAGYEECFIVLDLKETK